MSPDQRDQLARAALVQAQAERKRHKALGRIAKLKAKQAGELRRMPLTGRAAFIYIWRKA